MSTGSVEMKTIREGAERTTMSMPADVDRKCRQLVGPQELGFSDVATPGAKLPG